MALASLTGAAAEAGNLPLAARALGALDTLSQPPADAGPAGAPPTLSADLVSALRAPACTAYVEEGRVAGIGLITTIYPR